MATGKGEVIASSYRWELENYSSTYGNLPTGQFIDSPTFIVQSSLFYLKLFPNGENMNYQRSVSLSLNLFTHRPAADQIDARFSFACFDEAKNIIASYDSVTMSPFSKHRGWGCSNFMDKSLFANSNIRGITIVCEVITKQTKFYKSLLTISPDEIQKDLQHFRTFKSQLNNPKFSDVRFKVQKQDIYAHKMILASSSSVFDNVFAAMYDQKMRKTDDDIVVINDFSYNVFSALLNYVYSGECSLSKDTLNELFEAAHKYKLIHLKKVCEEEMCKHVTVKNAIALLELADKYTGEKLKLMVIDFIKLHGRDIITRPEFDSLRNSHPDIYNTILQDVSNS